MLQTMVDQQPEKERKTIKVDWCGTIQRPSSG